MTKKYSYLFALLIGLVTACTSTNEASEEYHDALRGKRPSPSERTTLFFMVDGLANEELRTGLARKRIPEIERFFLGNASAIYQSQSIFPTLTFPNSTSYLTSLPVDQHGISNNQMLSPSGELIDFTSPESVDKLNAAIKDKNIFTFMKDHGKSSVSLDSFYREGSDAHLHRDASLGLAYANGEYQYIDDHTIGSLRELLEKTPLKLWPEFIYIHLVGIDSMGHEFGPTDARLFDYFHRLDAQLGPVFKILRLAEQKGHSVLSLMGADHGMIDLKHFVDLPKLVSHWGENIKITNPGRAADLYLPSNWPAAKTPGLLAALKGQPGVDLVLHREGNRILIESAQLDATIDYEEGGVSDQCGSENYRLRFEIHRGSDAYSSPNFYCPADFDVSPHPFYSSPFVRNMGAFFRAPGRPDILVLAAEATSFSNGIRGEHGGITPAETLTPLLLRNVALDPSYVNRPVPVFELLRFLRLPTER